MVGEMSSVLPVDELTSLFYVLGHARGAAAEHPNLPDLLEKEVKASSVFGGSCLAQCPTPGSCETPAGVLGGDSFQDPVKVYSYCS